MEYQKLINKYNSAAPRYTSYPSVPYWNGLAKSIWPESIRNSQIASWSLYLHMPFCESLCTFCGCTKIITKNHNKEEAYIDLLEKELAIYLNHCPNLKQIPLRQIHFGGGSPTFFKAKNLEKIINYVFKNVSIDKEHFEGSIEADPRTTSKEQLQILKNYGFNRISLGVQDFDSGIQKIVHRIQPYHLTYQLTQDARALGFESVNYDLIYGLPKQTLQTMSDTLDKVVELKPDRIAFYSFAYVPWIKPSQKLFKQEDLPNGELKFLLYSKAKQHFLDNGYQQIGIDHFSLKTDALAVAQEENRLYRNFMGYTDQKSDALIGLGLSAISEIPNCYHQNFKDLAQYDKCIREGTIGAEKTHFLSQRDIDVKKQVQDLLINFSVELSGEQINQLKNDLKSFVNDKLIQFEENRLKVLENGRPFVRLICTFFDDYYPRGKLVQELFSQTI